MAGIAQEETPIEQMYIFSSKLMTSRLSVDIFLNQYDNDFWGKFHVANFYSSIDFALIFTKLLFLSQS